MTVFGPYQGVVDHVTDGDTINIRLDVGFDLTVYTRVRVLGINAPELFTPGGKAARSYAESLLPVGTAVTVNSHGWDKYGGRIDGEIRTGVSGPDFASEMLLAGHAKPWDGTGKKP